jgi:ubiquitin-like 1-activating enzyme E1 A
VVEKEVTELDEKLLASFDIVVASRIGKDEASRIARATTANGGKFYLVDCFGLEGAAVIDLGRNHEYRKEIGKDELSDVQKLETYLSMDEIWKVPLSDITMKRVDKTPPTVWLQYRSILEYHAQTKAWPTVECGDRFIQFVQEWISQNEPTLTDLECFQDAESLKRWAALATLEISPVCAVLGGVMGNELIKAISGKGEPANNVILLSGNDAKCRNILVQPKAK